MTKLFRNDVIYPGLQLFKEGKRLQSVLDVPGVALGGWTNYNLYKGSSERDRNLTQTKLTTQLRALLDRIRSSDFAWPFVSPVKDVSSCTSIVWIGNFLFYRMLTTMKK